MTRSSTRSGTTEIGFLSAPPPPPLPLLHGLLGVAATHTHAGSPQVRLVLMVDIWHPEVTEPMKQQLARVSILSPSRPLAKPKLFRFGAVLCFALPQCALARQLP